MIFMVGMLAFAVLVIAGGWKTYSKAGEPGWAFLVPIVNLYFLCKITGRPVWWIILMLIPIVGIVIMLIISLDLAKSFGKGVGFGVGLFFLSPIFYCILGFGNAEYQGPSA